MILVILFYLLTAAYMKKRREDVDNQHRDQEMTEIIEDEELEAYLDKDFDEWSHLLGAEQVYETVATLPDSAWFLFSK